MDGMYSQSDEVVHGVCRVLSEALSNWSFLVALVLLVGSFMGLWSTSIGKGR